MKIGSKVIIKDPSCFYYGREAIIDNVTFFGSSRIEIFTVRMGNIYSAIKPENVQEATA
tara:strand:+ start:390 stop:566 length:177 start_codon:yes stop_codon:yes gene_type:complete